MEKISFRSVVPNVFAGREDLASEVWGRDVELEKGKTYLIEASSGRGKSTFCSYVIGYRRDYKGKITFDDCDISSLRVSDWVYVRMRHVSHLFQELRLFPELTAWENVEVKNGLTHFKSAEEISRWFDRLGISAKRDQKIGRMSFGQQQRVALVRALAQPFDFILLDEPISHLDDANAAKMAELVLEEAHKQGAGVVVTSIGKHMTLDYDMTIKL